MVKLLEMQFMAINNIKGGKMIQQLGLFDLPINTRRQSFHSVLPKAQTLRDRCYEVIKTLETTADEVAAALNESLLTIRPRISELYKKGLIEDTGIRRVNDSGKLATVWRAK